MRKQAKLSPRHQRAADRLQELIDEGQLLAPKFDSTSSGSEHPIANGKQNHALKPVASSNEEVSTELHAWRTKVDNIIGNVCGMNGAHYRHLTEMLRQTHYASSSVRSIAGVLQAALSDLKGGFLIGQEQLIVGEVFDSFLDQAKALQRGGYSDAAAVLARAVIEDALRRLCRDEGLEDSGKPTTLNERLRKNGRYGQPQWRQIGTWLDIGNSAAHGKRDQYDQVQVARMIEDVERFVAQQLGA